MKATELIEKQHREVEELFAAFEKADDDEKSDIFDRIATSLVAHDAIEREMLYPAYERAAGSDDTLKEALVEHGTVEFALFRASKNAGKESFDAFVKALKEIVMHHVHEEEDQFIPKARKKLGSEMDESLGERMETRFEEVKQKDYAKPLRDAVQQLMTGRAKIDTRGKKRAATTARRAAPKKRATRTTRKATSGRGSRARARRR